LLRPSSRLSTSSVSTIHYSVIANIPPGGEDA